MTDGKVRYAYENGTWFIKLQGAICHPLGPTINTLVEQAITTADSKHFVIDLREAKIIDSTCLGILTRVATGKPRRKGPKPVIISGGGTIAKTMQIFCFHRLFDMVESPGTEEAFPLHTETATGVSLLGEDMLALLLDAHRRLCAIDAETHSAFKDVVEALEHEVDTKNHSHQAKV